jgi:hypothetical protein
MITPRAHSSPSNTTRYMTSPPAPGARFQAATTQSATPALPHAASALAPRRLQTRLFSS